MHQILSTKWLNPNLDKILMFVSHTVHAVVDYKENYVVRSRNEWKLKQDKTIVLVLIFATHKLYLNSTVSDLW